MRRPTPFFVALLLLLLLAACSQSPQPSADLQQMRAASDRYIVVLDAQPSVADPAAGHARAVEVARAHGLQPLATYGAALVGFAAVVPEGRLAALQRDPRVKYVEADQRVRIFAQTSPTGIRRIHADTLAVDADTLLIDGADDFRVDVDVAVLDTGIDLEHPDLNVVGGADCTLNSMSDIMFGRVTCQDGGGDDDHYHGTHVAGTIGALDDGQGVVGVAPGARLWAVKVLDQNGSGYTSEIVAGIDWVTARSSEIEVINMSLGGSGTSQANDDAIAAATDAGVVVVVAAGNSADEAANYTPANSPDAFTISALADFDGEAGGAADMSLTYCRDDQDDTLADFSNFDSTGNVVDMIAPGVCILSTYPLEQGEYGTISGTSMASPHVAGAAALLASGSGKPVDRAGVEALKSELETTGNGGWTGDADPIQEPLADVTGYAPALVPGGGSGGGSDPAPSDVQLEASGYKVKGVQHVDLTWSPGGAYDLYRNGTVIHTVTEAETSYTDNTGAKGGGTYEYQLCTSDLATCSNVVTVTF